MAQEDQPYDYTTAGFDSFLTRSIDSTGTLNLAQATVSQTQEINYDQSPASGSLGNILKIGNIQLDGSSGIISILDENGLEAIRIGNLDG